MKNLIERFARPSVLLVSLLGGGCSDGTAPSDVEQRVEAPEASAAPTEASSGQPQYYFGGTFCAGTEDTSGRDPYTASIYSYMPGPGRVLNDQIFDPVGDECFLRINDRFHVSVADERVDVGAHTYGQVTWLDLFEYKTYVANSGWTEDSPEEHSSESTMVTFDINQTGSGAQWALVRIEPRNMGQWETIESVVVRPRSAGAVTYVSGGNAYVYLRGPKKVSVEINGDRYRGVHVFANGPNEECPDPAAAANRVTVYETGITLGPQIAETNTNIKRQYAAQSDDEDICFEPGAIFRGSLEIKDKEGVSVHGHGLLDQVHLPKRLTGHEPFVASGDYTSQRGVYVAESSKVHVEGLIFNDLQMNPIHIVGSEHVTINDVKVIDQVPWGDGIQIMASKHVEIEDAFLRTNDDSIAISATSTTPWGVFVGSTEHVSVKNTSFYADGAHPIVIGWRGNAGRCIARVSGDPTATSGNFGCEPDEKWEPVNSSGNVDGDAIFDIAFEDIDILEMGQPLDPIVSDYYWGALAIKCGDENDCSNIRFKNVRIEDFTEGRLFSVIVEPGGNGEPGLDGRRVRNIRFEDIYFNRYGKYGSIIEHPSKIVGINADRSVQGVRFKNFRVGHDDQNMQAVSHLNSHRVSCEATGPEGDCYLGQKAGFNVGPHVSDITFDSQECAANLNGELPDRTYVANISPDEDGNDDGDELVLLNREHCHSLGSIRVNNVASGEEKTVIPTGLTDGFTDPGDFSALADVNKDGVKDLVLANLQRPSSPDVMYGLTIPGERSRDVMVIDLVTGKAISHLKDGLFGQTLADWVDPGDKMFVGDADGDQDQQEDLVFLNTDNSSGDAWAVRAMDLMTGETLREVRIDSLHELLDPGDLHFVGNFDNDPASELLLVNKQGGAAQSNSALKVIDLDTEAEIFCSNFGATGNCTPTSDPYEIWLEESDRAYVSDIDGDNQDDLVLINTQYAGRAIRVIDLADGSNIVDFWHGLFGGFFDEGDKILFADIDGSDNGEKEIVLVNASDPSGSALMVVDLFTHQRAYCSSWTLGATGWCSESIASGSYDTWLNRGDDRLLIGNFQSGGSDDLLFINRSDLNAIRVMDLVSRTNYGVQPPGTFEGWLDGVDENSL